MRQYVLTDIPAKVLQDMEASLAEMGCQASIEHLFWLPVPQDMLSPLQKEHLGSCGFWCAPEARCAATASPTRRTSSPCT